MPITAVVQLSRKSSFETPFSSSMIFEPIWDGVKVLTFILQFLDYPLPDNATMGRVLFSTRHGSRNTLQLLNNCLIWQGPWAPCGQETAQAQLCLYQRSVVRVR